MLPLALCKSRGWLDMLPLSDQPESQQEDQMFVKRLRKDDRERARETFTLMANVFETRIEPLSDSYLDALLERESFWALAAFLGSTVVGGLSTGLVHIRKAGSRRGNVEIFAFRDDCRTDKTFEVASDAVQAGDNVLVVDDWSETGAQLKAA